MKVEVYEQTEMDVTGRNIDNPDKCKELVDRLGLDGQKAYLCPDPSLSIAGIDVVPMRRVSFREMTADELLVYRALCPTASSLKEFSTEPIPLRILEVAEHAKTSGLFVDLSVWTRESQVVKDPLLVGIRIPNSQREYDKRFYLLARWGEELESFSVLREKAIAFMRERTRQNLTKIRALLTLDEELLKTASDDTILKTTETHYYGVGLR